MLAFFAALAIVSNFIVRHGTCEGVDRPVKAIWSSIAGARGFRAVVRGFGCEFINRTTYQGHSQELQSVLCAAGFDVYHLGEGRFVIDLGSAANKDMRDDLNRFGQVYFSARLTAKQRHLVGLTKIEEINI